MVGDDSMGWRKKDVTPLLMHWSYIILALTHQHGHDKYQIQCQKDAFFLLIIYETSSCYNRPVCISVNPAYFQI